MSAYFLYTTFGSVENAHEVANVLVEQRLVACANILPQMQSVYWWEDKVQTGDEVAVIFKTTEDLYDKAEAAIKELHSFDCPCIVTWPIEKGYAPYLEWIKNETRS